MKQIARSYELLGEQLFATFLTYAQIDIWRKLLYHLSSIVFTTFKNDRIYMELYSIWPAPEVMNS